MVMNKKTIIQLVIISAGFLGTAIVLYNGFFGKAQQQIDTGLVSNVNMGENSGEVDIAGAPEKILPYGETLDFDKVLTRQRLKHGIVNFPILNEAMEVGIAEDELIKPPPKKSIDN